MNLPSTPPANATEAELIAIISGGIGARGYHVSGDEELALLWGAETLTPTEKLMRLHTFSTTQGWRATGRSECRSALFQAEKQGPVSEASWRLDGDVERALGGRFTGVRGSA